MYLIPLRFPEEKILAISKTTLTVAREHTADLLQFGINNGYLDIFETQITETESLYDENKERHDLRILTELKAEALELCYKWCRDLILRLELAMGKSSIVYRTFPSKLLLEARYSESKMSPLMETIIKIAEENDTALSAFGQTPQVLTDGNNFLEQLRNADSEQELKKVHKKNATQIRHEKFNELYNTVNSINKVGRNLFKKDPPKYVLFESPWGSSESGDAKLYTGEIEAGTSTLIAEELDRDSLVYTENTGYTDLIFYAGEKTEETPALTLTPGEEATVNLSEIGEGNSLTVENPDSEKTGEYKVKL